MAEVDVRLLDGFSVVVDGVPVAATDWHLRKSAELVALLALAPGAKLHRERVVDALWPDVTVDRALPGCTRPCTSRARRWPRHPASSRSGTTPSGWTAATGSGSTQWSS